MEKGAVPGRILIDEAAAVGEKEPGQRADSGAQAERGGTGGIRARARCSQFGERTVRAVFFARRGVASMSVPSRRRLEVEMLGDVTIVNFLDKRILDEQSVQAIGEQLFSLVDELGRKKLLLNFGNVEYLSSPVLGIIATLNKKVKAAGGRLIACNLDAQIDELLKRSDLAGDEDDPDEGLGGVESRLKPPKPWWRFWK
jgi:anti-sigma B factor antagonist